MRKKPAESGKPDPVERILIVATTLFAERGLHGVTTRELAAAVGLNVATVHYHAGTKEAIYQAAVRRLDRIELDLLTAFTSRFMRQHDVTREWLRGYLSDVSDAIITFVSAYPEIARMRVRQWLEPIEGVEDPQADATRPAWAVLEESFEAARRANVLDPAFDTRIFGHSYDWLIAGFFSGGAAHGTTRAPRTPAEIDAFRGYLKAYTLQMLGLADG